jgi:hypothetical protein
MKRQPYIFTIGMIALLSITALASCSQTFTVPSLNVTTIQLRLNQGDTVSGSIMVSGGVGNDINFRVTDPQWNDLLIYSRIIQTEFSFQAPTSGSYILHFDNTIGLGALPKTITLDYNITQSIAGIPRNTFLLFLAFAIAVLIIIAAVIFVLLYKNRH